MKYGYMGLIQPIETLWADGRKVLVEPNGKVTDLRTNQIIRQQDRDFETVFYPQSQNNNNQNQMFIILAFMILVIAIVAIVALTNGRKHN